MIIPYFRWTHIHTSIHTYIIFPFNAFTFLPHFLLWSHNFLCWKIVVAKAVSNLFTFIMKQLFQLLHINTLQCMLTYLVIILLSSLFYSLCIVGQKFIFFVDSFHHHLSWLWMYHSTRAYLYNNIMYGTIL